MPWSPFSTLKTVPFGLCDALATFEYTQYPSIWVMLLCPGHLSVHLRLSLLGYVMPRPPFSMHNVLPFRLGYGLVTFWSPSSTHKTGHLSATQQSPIWVILCPGHLTVHLQLSLLGYVMPWPPFSTCRMLPFSLCSWPPFNRLKLLPFGLFNAPATFQYSY